MGKKKRLINRILSVVLSLALVFTGVSFQGMAVQAEEAAPDAEGLDVPQAEEADAPEAREPKAQAEDGLILHYDFDQGDNSEATIVMDKTGNTAHSAEVVKAEGAVAGTYAWGKENVLGKTMNTLELNTKNEDYGPYLKLPDDIFNGCDSATISILAQMMHSTAFGISSQTKINISSSGLMAGTAGAAWRLSARKAGMPTNL